MAYEVKGVVARSKGAPVTVETIVVPDPGPGEAVVDVQACGVCATDLHYREGDINDDFPFLLGHEAAGIVSAVGEGVTNVAVGDYVILNWRAVCGQCRACLKGQPQYCFATHNAAQKMTLADGTELSPALGIGAFVEKTLVHSGQCTKVDPAAPPTAAGLLGCGVMAGVGAAINTGGGAARRERRGVRLRRRRGRRDRRGQARRGDHDHRRRPRRPEARVGKKFGATHTVNSQQTDAVEAIKALHRRLRRRRGDRRGRPPEGLRAGLLRPRPGRTRGHGRRPDADHDDRAAGHRDLRPGRRDQVLLVRRLPAQPRGRARECALGGRGCRRDGRGVRDRSRRGVRGR